MVKKMDFVSWPPGELDRDEEQRRPLLQPQGGDTPRTRLVPSTGQPLNESSSGDQPSASHIEVITRSEPVKWPSARLLSILWRATRIPENTPKDSIPSTSGHSGPASPAPAGLLSDDLQIRRETDQTKNCLLLLMTALNNTEELKRLLVKLRLNPNITGLQAGDDLFDLQKWGLWDSPALELIANHMLDLNWTPLHVATARSQEKCAFLLLNAQAEPNSFDRDTMTVLDVAGSLTDFDDELHRRSFTSIIGLILQAGGRPGVTRDMTSPLHLAVEFEIDSVLDKLLSIEEYLICHDKLGDTPLHLCMHKKYFEPLKILTNANHKYYDRYGWPTILNTQNTRGYTVLHAAVEAGWVAGVWFALDKGADIMKKANDVDTPIHLAASLGYLEILIKLLDFVNQKNLKDQMDDKGENIIFNALTNGHFGCVKAILRNDPSIIEHTSAGENVFHVAAKKGHDDILHLLIDFYLNICKRGFGEDKLALETLTETDGFGPIHYAVQENHITCVEILILLLLNFKGKSLSYRLKTGTANVDIQLCEGSTPLHIAAKYNHAEIARLLLSYDNTLLCEKNSGKEFPLHVAINNGSRDVILVLLSEGANLADCPASDEPDIRAKSKRTENGRTEAEQTDTERSLAGQAEAGRLEPGQTEIELHELGRTECSNIEDKSTFIEMIINNLENPTQFLEDVFDSYITSNGLKTVDPNYEVKVDYKILMPGNREKSQMMVIEALLKTGDTYGQKKLLVHPIVESLLHLKWTALQPFFFMIILIHALFVLSLTCFCYSVFVYQHYDAKDFVVFEGLDSSAWTIMLKIYNIFWGSLLICSIGLMTLQEFTVYEGVKGIQYLFQLETWMKLGSIGLAIILMFSVIFVDTEEVEWPRHVASITLLVAWIQIMILLSRIPKWGFYVLMFGKVSLNVFKILLTFSFLIVGFALSFMILLKTEPPFDSPISALTKTVVMMTSEFDYGSFFEDNTNQTGTNETSSIGSQPKFSTSSVVVFRLIFVTFLVLVGIVLMNLIVGVAVNDISNLELLGNIQRLEKQAEFLITLDKLVYSPSFIKIWPKRMINKIKLRRNIVNVGKLRPGKKRSKYDQMLTAEIRDAILKNAEEQKKEKEDENSHQHLKQLLYEAIAEIKHKNIDGAEPGKNLETRKLEHKKVIDKLRKLDVATTREEEMIVKTSMISIREQKRLENRQQAKQ